MSVTVTWLGHGGLQIANGTQTILLDPFLTDSPTATMSVEDAKADVILVSHGHFDHIADVPAIAKKTNAKVVAIYEVAQWLAQTHSVEDTIGMNIGGWVDLGFAKAKMTPALHSSSLPDGSYGGDPAGFVLEIQGKKIYFACDTALFSDMQLIGQMGLDLAVLPIGDLFTMGIEDSVTATKFLNPNRVAPAHYGTWPPIEQDANTWPEKIRNQTSAEPIVVDVGGSFEL